LAEPHTVAGQPERALGREFEVDAGGLCLWACGLEALVREDAEIEASKLEPELARVELGHEQEVVDETLQTFPPLLDQVWAQRPGGFRRSKVWWETRRLRDDPARRRGAGPLTRALLELDGEPAGYALYRVQQEWSGGPSSGTVTVLEAVAPTPEATRELWRWLLDFDWTSQFVADLLPLDHPLFLLLAEPRRMAFELNDGVWLRLVDVGAALSARSYEDDGELVLELADPFCPWNEGRWHVSAAGAERTDAGADLHLDATGLGSVYLGGFGFGDLLRASRVEELRAGAVARADALFRTGIAPWCAEIF